MKNFADRGEVSGGYAMSTFITYLIIIILFPFMVLAELMKHKR